jgi:hypothetical protein
MATRFIEGSVQSNLPWGVICRTAKGLKLVSNGLNQRLPLGADVLIADTDGRAVVIGRRRP